MHLLYKQTRNFFHQNYNIVDKYVYPYVIIFALSGIQYVLFCIYDELTARNHIKLLEIYNKDTRLGERLEHILDNYQLNNKRFRSNLTQSLIPVLMYFFFTRIGVLFNVIFKN